MVLHIDPEAAKKAGFDTPILHGLCSFGIVCRAVVDGFLDGDVTRIGSYRGRFAQPVSPGETIVTSMWREGERILLSAAVKERNLPILTHAWVEPNE